MAMKPWLKWTLGAVLAAIVAFGCFAPLCGLLFDHFGRGAAFYLCALAGVLGTLALLLRGRTARATEGLTAEPASGRFTRS